MRVAAIVALGDLSDGMTETATIVAPAVVGAFADHSGLVRSFALDAFGRLGPAGFSHTGT